MTDIKELAEIYSCQFDRGIRPSGREYFYPSGDSDSSLQKLIDYAIGDVDLNDTSFEFVNNALTAIDGFDDMDNVELSIVATHLDLMCWLTDSYDRSERIEDLVNYRISNESTYEFDMFDVMETAYTQEAYEVLYAVIEYLSEQLDIADEV